MLDTLLGLGRTEGRADDARAAGEGRPGGAVNLKSELIEERHELTTRRVAEEGCSPGLATGT